jgi:hypothetical protein
MRKIILISLGLVCILVVMITGCTDSTSAVNTFHGKTFSADYPGNWQVFDAYSLYTIPESDRDTIPEAVIFAPSTKYPTPITVGVYNNPLSASFGKTEADARLNLITQGQGTTYTYIDTITVGGEPAYEYRSRDPNGNEVRNVLLREGSHVYFIQSYKDEKNLALFIQSFKPISTSAGSPQSPPATPAIVKSY